MISGCDCGGSSVEAPGAENEVAAPAETTDFAASRCEQAQQLLDATPAPEPGLDVEAARQQLLAQAGLNRSRTLERIARSGPDAAALRTELRTLMASSVDERTAAAAARAWAVASLEFPDEVVALLRDPDTPIGSRFELAAVLGAYGEFSGLVEAAQAPGVARDAAQRGLFVGRGHLEEIRELFAEGGQCAAFTDDSFCADLARDLVVHDASMLDDAPTPQMRLVAAEEMALRGRSDALDAWESAAEELTGSVAIAASVERLASNGLAHVAGTRLASLSLDTSLSDRQRQVAAYLSTWTPPGPPEELAVDADPIAAAAWGLRAAARGEALPEGWATRALSSLGRRANPFQAIVLLTVAATGERDAAIDAAGARFPDEFGDLLRAVADDNPERALSVILTGGRDDALAADAFFVASRREAVAWKALLDASTDGTPARRAALLARLGSDNPDAVASVSGGFTELPPLEVVRWLHAAAASASLEPLVAEALQSENPNTRRHASIVVSAFGVGVDSALLQDAIVMDRRQQQPELRDTRTTSLRALMSAGEPTLDDAIALRRRSLEARQGLFESAAWLDVAVEAHCED